MHGSPATARACRHGRTSGGPPGRGVDDGEAHARLAHQYAAGTRPEAGEAFRWLLARGGRTLVVEDDVGVRSHPGLTDVAFVGDRLLRWCALSASCEEAVTLLNDGATGYPRNAFVCDADSATLGLQVGRTLDEDAGVRLASYAQAVISGVWDDECYVLCWSPTGSGATTP